MPDNGKAKAATLSFLITLAVAVAAVLVELIHSTSLSMTSGMSLSADSFSARFVTIMIAGLVAVFFLIYFRIRSKDSGER